MPIPSLGRAFSEWPVPFLDPIQKAAKKRIKSGQGILTGYPVIY